MRPERTSEAPKTDLNGYSVFCLLSAAWESAFLCDGCHQLVHPTSLLPASSALPVKYFSPVFSTGPLSMVWPCVSKVVLVPDTSKNMHKREHLQASSLDRTL